MVSKSRMSRAVPPFSPMCLNGVDRDSLPFSSVQLNVWPLFFFFFVAVTYVAILESRNRAFSSDNQTSICLVILTDSVMYVDKNFLAL